MCELLWASGSASCDVYIYIYIDRVRDRLYEIFRTLVSASCDIIREIRGARWNGHWALHLVIYHARYGGYDLLQALCPASCDFTHETGATIFCDHWVLYLVIAQTRTGIDLSRALDSASCDNTRTHTHEIGDTTCYWHVFCIL